MEIPQGASGGGAVGPPFLSSSTFTQEVLVGGGPSRWSMGLQVGYGSCLTGMCKSDSV